MKIFIIGLVFGLFIQPIFDGLTSLCLSFFEMIKSYFALKITHNNQKIEQMSSTTTSKTKIGFLVGEEVEDSDL